MKKLFCMQSQGKYRAHVAQKQSRCRGKRILRKLGEEVSSGSEKNITPEADWMAKQGLMWTKYEEDTEEPIPAADSDDESFSA